MAHLEHVSLDELKLAIESAKHASGANKGCLKRLEQQVFYHGVQIIYPHQEPLLQVQPPHYYHVQGSLDMLLDPTFLLELKQAPLVGLAYQGRSDRTDVVALLPSGHLVLSLHRDTYETLGLQGKNMPKKDRFLVTLPLSTMEPGNSLYDRVAWCFKTNYHHPMKWVFQYADSHVSSTPSFPKHVQVDKIVMKSEQSCMSNIRIPDMTRLSDLVSQGDTEEIQEYIEWMGMASMACSRIQSRDCVDPFISRYSVPVPSTVGNMQSIEMKGFMSCFTILQHLSDCQEYLATSSLDWIMLLCWGFKDVPHGPNGNNMVFFLSKTQGCILHSSFD